MKITVSKLTDVGLLRKANSFTTGKDSNMSLRRAYASMHSPIRTQLFFIEMEEIPLFCASQFVRSKVGVEWWQRSKRTDRGGADFNDICRNLAFGIKTEVVGKEDCYAGDLTKEYEKWADAVEALPKHFDRYTPTSIAGLFNAESIINMSHKRLCAKVSKETREIWREVLNKLKEADPELYPLCTQGGTQKRYNSGSASFVYHLVCIRGFAVSQNRVELLKTMYSNK